jgi:hypothetical protein
VSLIASREFIALRFLVRLGCDIRPRWLKAQIAALSLFLDFPPDLAQDMGWSSTQFGKKCQHRLVWFHVARPIARIKWKCPWRLISSRSVVLHRCQKSFYFRGLKNACGPLALPPISPPTATALPPASNLRAEVILPIEVALILSDSMEQTSPPFIPKARGFMRFECLP